MAHAAIIFRNCSHVPSGVQPFACQKISSLKMTEKLLVVVMLFLSGVSTFKRIRRKTVKTRERSRIVYNVKLTSGRCENF